MKLGIIFHNAANKFYAAFRENRLINPEDLVNTGTLAQLPRESHTLIRNALTFLRAHYWKGHEVVAIEEPFFMDLAPGLPPVIGVQDLVLRCDSILLVVDHKTSKTFNDLDCAQLLLYAEPIRRQYATDSIIGFFDEYRLVLDLSSIRKPAFRRTRVNMDRSLLAELIIIYRKAWAKMVEIQKNGEPTAAPDCWLCRKTPYFH